MEERGDLQRRVIDAWISTEVLTPVTVRSWDTLAEEMGGTLIAGILPIEPAPPREQRRAWYLVVLGAIDTGLAFELINGVFAPTMDEAEEIEQPDGQAIAATITLDGAGRYLPGSLNIAAFPWGVALILRTSKPTPLREWDAAARSIKDTLERRFDLASPTPPVLGLPALADISGALREQLGLPSTRWSAVPAIIQLWRTDPPQQRLLSSLYLPDLVQVRRAAESIESLPRALGRYLGAIKPDSRWDPLTDRRRLAELAAPAQFPAASWPGPGRHPLTLLQQTAVNAIARDLKKEGLAAVNGPPGTGKTTLLRDLVAHVLTQRAEFLVGIDDPAAAIKNHVEGKDPLDLLDFAIVVGSSNNAAAENVTEAIPLRSAIDRSCWDKLSYFAGTADKLLGVPAQAPAERHAWGLVAARLGSASNRARFTDAAWFDEDWGLDGWFDEAARRGTCHGLPPILAAEPPLGESGAKRRWQQARQEFQAALAKAEHLRAVLEQARADLAQYGPMKRLSAELEAKVTKRAALTARYEGLLQDAERRAQIAQDVSREHKRGLERSEKQVPGLLHRLFNTQTAVLHRKRIARDREVLKCLSEETAYRLQRATTLREELDRFAAAEQAERARWGEAQAAERAIIARLRTAVRVSGNSLPVDLWEKAPDQTLFAAAPWNGGDFREARFRVFVAAVRLHRAFLEAAAYPLRRSLRRAIDVMKGRAAPVDGAEARRLWGVLFLLVPVVSSTFASFSRMFESLGARDLGWVLIDEAGQATPQAALGAIWRARRAVVIGDPCQIEPVVTLPEQLGRRICGSLEIDYDGWAAPKASVQTLADRQSAISAIFPGYPLSRQVGMPLLVHRRCEEPMFGLSVRRHGKLDWRRHEELDPLLSEGGPDGRVDGGPWRPLGGRSGRWDARARRGGCDDPAASAGLGRSADRRGDRLQPHDGASVSRGGWAGGLPGAGAVLGAGRA